MTIKQLKEGVIALVKKGVGGKAITLQDRLTREYIDGYNKAVLDVLALIEIMKKDIKNGDQRET